MKRTILWGMLLIIMLASTGCPGGGHEKYYKEAETKQNVHSIQIALERYVIDHPEFYPGNLMQLVDEDYIDELPVNAFTGETMANVEYSDSAPAGDFTYIPVEIDDEVKGYYLICYGEDIKESQDLNENGEADNVIEVIEGYIGDVELPPIKDLL